MSVTCPFNTIRRSIGINYVWHLMSMYLTVADVNLIAMVF